MKHPIPDWVARGKTIRQLILELQAFEDQDQEVRISLDHGKTHHPISIVTRKEAKYCVLENAEAYYAGEWQAFMDRDNAG